MANVSNATEHVDTAETFRHTLISIHPDSLPFKLVHSSAIIALFISSVASVYTLIYLKRSTKEPFFKWKIGQRMVVYLAVVDLLISLEHPIDHIYEVFQIEPGFEVFCTISAFLLQLFVSAQSILVSIIAVSAFVAIARNRRIGFGRYDWALLAAVTAPPVAAGTVMLALDWLGPSGWWCHADMRKASGNTVQTFYSVVMLATFLANLGCYAGVWIVIVSTANKVKKFGDAAALRAHTTHARTARILALFVFAYLAQWMAYVVYTAWNYVTEPSWILMEIVVLTSNSGGVFNYVAYTFVRRRSGATAAAAHEAGNHTPPQREGKCAVTETSGQAPLGNNELSRGV